MIKAHNLEEFIDANSALQMPFFNVIYADRDGHILYVFGGRQPVRQGGDWRKYFGVLDGSDPSLLWTRTFAWSELPRAIDPPGGFVANSNNPPWTSTFPQTPTNDPAKFPAYVAPQFMELRAQNGAGILLDLLKSSKKLTSLQVILGKESTCMLLADRVLPDLILAAKLSGNPTLLGLWPTHRPVPPMGSGDRTLPQPANQPIAIAPDENIWSGAHAHLNDATGTILVHGGFFIGGGVSASTERRAFLFNPTTNPPRSRIRSAHRPLLSDDAHACRRQGTDAVRRG